MTLHTYTLSRSPASDFKLFRAIARVHLAAWLQIPLMGAIMYRPELTNAANRARYFKTDTESLRNEDEVRFVVVLDDQLVPDELDEDKEEVDGVGDGERPKGRVIAAIKYYVVAATGAHPDAETQKEIDKQSASSVAADTDAATATTSDTGTKTPHMNHALSSTFVAGLIAARQEATQLIGTHVLIDNLYTDPAHHRRGAGGMLMRVAVQEADHLGLPCMLEASPMGMKVYESVGFEVLPGKHIWIDLLRWKEGGDKGVEFSEKRLAQAGGVRRVEDGWYVQMIMLRSAKSKGLESAGIE